jgi:hypothetical protein
LTTNKKLAILIKDKQQTNLMKGFKMSKVIKSQTAVDNFASKVVNSIKEGKITFGEPTNVKTKNASGVRYSNGSSLPQVELDILTKEGVKNARYVLNIRFEGEVKGSVKAFAITGNFARLAYKYITKKPAGPRKEVVSNEDLELANKVFGF